MGNEESWDWNTDLKEIPVEEWKERFNWVEDFYVSPDGESIASIVNVDETVFQVCVNGEVWDTEYEKIWGLRSLPDKGFSALVYDGEEWTLTRDGEEWSGRFDFIWDFQVTPDGKHLGIAFQKDSEYGMVIDDLPWDQVHTNMAGMTLSDTGTSAAVVQVAPKPNSDAAVWIDKTVFFAALLAIFENAVDACVAVKELRDKLEIKISVELKDKETLFRIRDNGKGLARKYQKEVFSLFYSDKGNKGTGLGLFIAQRSVKQHKGVIKINSVPGQYTEFTVAIPVRQA